MKKEFILRGIGTGMFVGALAFGTTSCSKIGDFFDDITSYLPSACDRHESNEDDEDEVTMSVVDDEFENEDEEIEVEEPDIDFDMADLRREMAATAEVAKVAEASKKEAREQKAAEKEKDTKAADRSETNSSSQSTNVPVADAKPAETSTNNNDPVSIAMVEQVPAFPGGEAAMYKWISQNLKYPATAAEEGIQGRVVVQFIIEKDGSVSNVKVVRGKHPALDAEAKRVVSKMPKWTPGRMNGQPVRVTYTLPVNFKLQL